MAVRLFSRLLPVIVFALMVHTAAAGLLERARETLDGATCAVALPPNNRLAGASSRGLILTAFNDILGSEINVSFSRADVAASMNRLPVGALRHPGGTVANYWSFQNASFIQPCRNGSQYDFCDAQRGLSWYPSQTFSPANFTRYVGNELQPPATFPYDDLRVVFDLNLLTLSPSETVAQIDHLLKTIPNASMRVKYLELGNEFYLEQYRSLMPTPLDYINIAQWVVREIRLKLPYARIAFISQPILNLDENTPWNYGVAQAKDLFDAVTVHDYSAYIDDLTDVGAWERLVLHGPSRLPSYAKNARTWFGESKTLWMTEFNVDRATTFRIGQLVGHTIFVFNYLFSAACETGEAFEITMLHMLWTQQKNWGLNQSLFEFSRAFGDPNATVYNGAAQLYSRLGRWAANTSLTGACAVFNPSTGCPIANITFDSARNISCVRGVAFADENGRQRYVITNGCGHNVTVTLVAVPKARIAIYTHLQSGPFVKLAACSGGRELYNCPPLVPAQQFQSNHTSDVPVALPALSVAFAEPGV